MDCGDRTDDKGSPPTPLMPVPFTKVRPPGVPFEVSLHRFLPAAPLPGHFQIKHEISGNLEEAREVRLREACAKTFPKLEAWRQKSGARTVLILEDNDLQLTMRNASTTCSPRLKPRSPAGRMKSIWSAP